MVGICRDSMPSKNSIPIYGQEFISRNRRPVDSSASYNEKLPKNALLPLRDRPVFVKNHLLHVLLCERVFGGFALVDFNP